MFLIGDAVGYALAGQQTPDRYFNLERMIKVLDRRGGEIGCCGTCIDSRGITQRSLAASARRSSMDELTDWTLWADQVVTL